MTADTNSKPQKIKKTHGDLLMILSLRRKLHHVQPSSTIISMRQALQEYRITSIVELQPLLSLQMLACSVSLNWSSISSNDSNVLYS